MTLFMGLQKITPTFSNGSSQSGDIESLLNKSLQSIDLDSEDVPVLKNYVFSDFSSLTVNCDNSMKFEPLCFSNSNVTLVRGNNTQTISSSNPVTVDNLFPNTSTYTINNRGTSISNLTSGINEISVYDQNFAPYKNKISYGNGETIFISNPKNVGITMELVPDTSNNTYSMSYDSVTYSTNLIHLNAFDETDVSFSVISTGKTTVENSYTPTESCRLLIPMINDVTENVVLSDTFDSSLYSKNYMEHYNYQTNSCSITISNNAIKLTGSGSSYRNASGYIKFKTPSYSTTVSVTCAASGGSSSASGSKSWCGAGVIIDTEIYGFSSSSFTSASNSKALMWAKNQSMSGTYTKELEPNTTYYLTYGIGMYSSAYSMSLSITNISFTALTPYDNNITVKDLNGNTIDIISPNRYKQTFVLDFDSYTDVSNFILTVNNKHYTIDRFTNKQLSLTFNENDSVNWSAIGCEYISPSSGSMTITGNNTTNIYIENYY